MPVSAIQEGSVEVRLGQHLGAAANVRPLPRAGRPAADKRASEMLPSGPMRRRAAARGCSGAETASAVANGDETPSIESPVVEQRRRIYVRRLFALAGALFAVNLLLPQVGQTGATLDAVRRASWPWLAVTVGLAATTYLMGTIALIGASGLPLPIGRTWMMQIASAFTNRLAPAGLGGMRTNVRYLERAGATRPAAVATVGLNTVAGFVVHVVGLVVILPLLGASNTHFRFSRPDVPDRWPLLVAFAGTVTFVGLLHWGVRLRGRIAPGLRSAWAGLIAAFRRPAGAIALFGGSAGVTLGYSLALVAAGRAMSIGLPVATVVAVYLGGSAVAAAAPTPGGLGALEATLVAGLTSAGAAAGPAVAAVLTYRLITYWLPVLPGMVAFHRMRRRGLL